MTSTTTTGMPAWAVEMGAAHHRPKLVWGIGAGYAVAGVYGVLALLGGALGLIEVAPLLWLITIKVLANTISWAALRQNRLVLETSGLNLIADLVALTGAIHLTGGIESPLLPIYGIELTVIALITNVGVTILTSVLTILLFLSMTLGTHFGLLSPQPSVLTRLGGVTDGYLIVYVVFAILVIGLPTSFAAAMLRRLQDKERQLRAKNAELAEAGRQRSQFMANITHELRTPIHGICGLSDLLEEGIYGDVNDKQAGAVRDVKASALSLLRLVDDLLVLAKDDAGQLTRRVELVDLKDVAQQVVSTARFLCGTRKLELTSEIEDGLPPFRTSRAHLVHILVNLLANAVKFTPDGGHVRLKVEARAGHAILSVIDDGIGIPASELLRVFEPFRQVDGSPERLYGGAGLGLSIVQELAGALGGKVTVESAMDRGSTFRVTLPLDWAPSGVETLPLAPVRRSSKVASPTGA